MPRRPAAAHAAAAHAAKHLLEELLGVEAAGHAAHAGHPERVLLARAHALVRLAQPLELLRRAALVRVRALREPAVGLLGLGVDARVVHVAVEPEHLERRVQAHRRHRVRRARRVRGVLKVAAAGPLPPPPPPRVRRIFFLPALYVRRICASPRESERESKHRERSYRV